MLKGLRSDILSLSSCSYLSLQRKMLSRASGSRSREERLRAIEDVASISGSIVEHGRSMMQREDSVIVPAISMLVSEPEQKAFNNKVIRNLGILDSRLHLVGMYEAVKELKDPSEQKLFEETIPTIPQKLIPRWKRKLYAPATKELSQW